ncbi:hypothetical protein DL96DRAFT_1628055 [Flagelloscypha sp. PMI_526]|nr:hypothetical protein DL96DRAFT_1628055 [Flagelloscypha sp. PMI_526]
MITKDSSPSTSQSNDVVSAPRSFSPVDLLPSSNSQSPFSLHAGPSRRESESVPTPREVVQPTSALSPLRGVLAPIQVVIGSRSVSRAKAQAARTKQRWMRPGKRCIGVKESLKNIAMFSCLNSLLIFLPCAFALYYVDKGQEEPKARYWATFACSFLAIMPLDKLAEWGGEQMSHYVGPNVGDLIIVTMHNAVEASLSLVLLSECRLRLLQSTIIGVVLLNLLLAPGIAFMVGGGYIRHQEIKSKFLGLSHVLLIIGVMSLIIPVAFASALRTTEVTDSTGRVADILTDSQRGQLLGNSRGLAVVLLTIYVSSRTFIHRPPPTKNPLDDDEEKMIRLTKRVLAARSATQISSPGTESEELVDDNEPKINQWLGVLLLAVVLVVLVFCAQFLVYSIEHVRVEGNIGQEFFGLIILPIVSFSADAAITWIYLIRRKMLVHLGKPPAPELFASARGIDLSVQFTLFWTPVIVLIGWWAGKPMSLYFDTFEVVAMLGACFVITQVTSDSKANWAKGYALFGFYVIIGLFAYQYPGETRLELLDVCGSVAEALAQIAEGASFADIGIGSE